MRIWPFNKQAPKPTPIVYREVFDPRSEQIRGVLTDAFVHHEEIGSLMCIWINHSGEGARISIVGAGGQVSGQQVSQLLLCVAAGTEALRRSM